MNHGSAWSTPVVKCLVLDELFGKVTEEEVFPQCFHIDSTNSQQLPKVCIPGKGLTVLNESVLRERVAVQNPVAVSQCLFYLSYSAPAGASVSLNLLNSLCENNDVIHATRESLCLVLIPLLRYMSLSGLSRAIPLIQQCLGSQRVMESVLLEIIPGSSHTYSMALLKILPPPNAISPEAANSPLLLALLNALPAAHLLHFCAEQSVVQVAHSILREHDLKSGPQAISAICRRWTPNSNAFLPLPTPLIRYLAYLLTAAPPECETYGSIDPRVEEYLLVNKHSSAPTYMLLRQLAGYHPKDVDWLLARRLHSSTDIYSPSIAHFVLALNDPVSQYDEDLAFELASTKHGYSTYASSVAVPPLLSYRPILCMTYDERREFLFIHATSIGGAAFRFPIQKLMKNDGDTCTAESLAKYPDSFKEPLRLTAAMVKHIRTTIADAVIPPMRFPDVITRGNAGGLVEMIISTVNKGVINKLVIPELNRLYKEEELNITCWPLTDRLIKLLIRWLNEPVTSVRNLEARLWLSALFTAAIPINSLAISKVTDLIFGLSLHALRNAGEEFNDNWKSIFGAITNCFGPSAAPARVADIIIRRILRPTLTYTPPISDGKVEDEQIDDAALESSRMVERRKMLRLNIHLDSKSKPLATDELSRNIHEAMRRQMDKSMVIKAALGDCSAQVNMMGHCPCTLTRTPAQWQEVETLLWQGCWNVSDLNVIWLAHNQTHLYFMLELYTAALIPKLVDWQMKPCFINALVITFWVRYMRYLHGRHERAAPPRICLELECKNYAWIISHMINMVWGNCQSLWLPASNLESEIKTLFPLFHKAGAPLSACINIEDTIYAITKYKYHQTLSSLRQHGSSVICSCKYLLSRNLPIPEDPLERSTLVLLLVNHEPTSNPFCDQALKRYRSLCDDLKLLNEASDEPYSNEGEAVLKILGFKDNISAINPQVALKVFSPWTSWD